MNKPIQHKVNKTIDSVQQRLTDYACSLKYDDFSPEVIHAAKVRVIDTLGALIGGFYGEPCRIVRGLAAGVPDVNGATVIGTRIRTTLDMAVFANTITARYPEMNDSYHLPGSMGGHPSDVVTPIITVAEKAQVSGRQFITGIILAYEVYLRISDVFHNEGFDDTNFACIGTAVAAGKLLGLSSDQLSHCISMAVVPNVILRQMRYGHRSMFKAAAAGYAGRAGVFAALLAQAGMEGPHLPFEGKAGWREHVVRGPFSLTTLGGNGTSFKILDSRIKLRPCGGKVISSILAAEKIAPLNIRDVIHVTIEVNKQTKESAGAAEMWNPGSREGADHSAPYVVAATLMDGTLTLRSFNDAHLWNPELRALMQKIEVVENTEYTKAYERMPMEERTRVTVVMSSGERLVGESGGDQDDLAAPKSDAQIVEKFRGLSEDILGTKRVNAILDRLWHLEEVRHVSEIPPALVFI